MTVEPSPNKRRIHAKWSLFTVFSLFSIAAVILISIGRDHAEHAPAGWGHVFDGIGPCIWGCLCSVCALVLLIVTFVLTLKSKSDGTKPSYVTVLLLMLALAIVLYFVLAFD